MNQHDLSALPLAKLLDQPIVETTDFEDGHERLAVDHTLAGEPLKKLADLRRLRRDLSRLDDIAVFVA